MYKIIAVDGKEYGPVSLEHIRKWIAEGRVNGQTRMQPVGATEWKAATEFPEIAALLTSPAQSPPPLPPTIPGQRTSPGTIGALPSATQPSSGLAIGSFVLGLLSFVMCLGVVTGLPAIIMGHMARARAQRSPAQYAGSGFAVAGFILGYLSLLYTVLLVAMLVPAVVKARHTASSAQCASNMKQIGLAFRIWAVDHDDQFPFNVSTNSGGTLEFCARGNDDFDESASKHFAAVSNELGSSRPLLCPGDHGKQPASDWTTLSAANVSYQLRTGPGITETNPTETLVYCPIHRMVLKTDGSIQRNTSYQ